MSKRVKMIFPVPMSEATRPMVESQLPPEFRRSDIAVSFVGAGSTIIRVVPCVSADFSVLPNLKNRA